MTAPLLVFGWGNASRGDDALGPLLVQQLQAALADVPGIEFLDDYQLQPEHVLDLLGRRQVLFVDASLRCQPPFEVSTVQPAQDRNVSTHALSPQALLAVYRQVHGTEPPPCTLLAVRGERFGLGEPPTAAAQAHLSAALAWARAWLALGLAPGEDAQSGR